MNVTDIILILFYLLIVILLGICVHKVQYRSKRDEKDTIIPFDQSGIQELSLPFARFFSNGKPVYFVVDSGANFSTIDKNGLKQLEHTKLDDEGSSYGINGDTQHTEFANVCLHYGDKSFIDRFQVFEDMSGALNHLRTSTGLPIIGILGSCFFRRYKFLLDFKELVMFNTK